MKINGKCFTKLQEIFKKENNYQYLMVKNIGVKEKDMKKLKKNKIKMNKFQILICEIKNNFNNFLKFIIYLIFTNNIEKN